MREVKSEDFVGKTIAAIDAQYGNVIGFSFTDGTTLELWSESGSSIPFFFIDEPGNLDEMDEDEESENEDAEDERDDQYWEED